MRLIDICVNLDNGQFRDDRDGVIERAAAAGVDRFMITATDLASTRTALALCRPPHTYCTAGVHPHDAGALNGMWFSELAGLAAEPEVRAIGETGLDFNRNYSPRDRQIEAFRSQIELAQELDKPLFVHDRDTEGMVLKVLVEAAAATPLPPVVIHCFTGSRQDLDGYLAAGFSIGVTGWVADPRRGAELRSLVPHIPLDRLMIETDAPFLRPANAPETALRDGPDGIADDAVTRRHRKRNEPALLPWVLDAIAAARGESRETLARAVTRNAEAFFGFDPLSPPLSASG